MLIPRPSPLLLCTRPVGRYVITTIASYRLHKIGYILKEPNNTSLASRQGGPFPFGVAANVHPPLPGILIPTIIATPLSFHSFVYRNKLEQYYCPATWLKIEMAALFVI